MGEEPTSPMEQPRLPPPRALAPTLLVAPEAATVPPPPTIHVPSAVAQIEGLQPPAPASPIGTSASAIENRRLKAKLGVMQQQMQHQQEQLMAEQLKVQQLQLVGQATAWQQREQASLEAERT